MEVESIDDWAAGATIGGLTIPPMPDLARMRKARFERLQHQLDVQGIDGLVLLGSSSVADAAGAAVPAQDGDGAAMFRAVAVVVKGDSAPHLYTAFVNGVPIDLPPDHLHGPLFPDLDDGIDVFARALAEPGITERELLGVYYERVASLGSPMAPSESVCFATPTQGPVRFRHLATDRPVGDGELVVLAPSALYAGYEAGLARTRVAGSTVPQWATDLATRYARGMDALVAACRSGNTGADLYRTWESEGNPESPVPLAHGIGLGAEPR